MNNNIMNVSKRLDLLSGSKQWDWIKAQLQSKGITNVSQSYAKNIIKDTNVRVVDNKPATIVLLSTIFKNYFGVKISDDDSLMPMVMTSMTVKHPYITIEDITLAFSMTDSIEKKDFQSLTVTQVMNVIDRYFRIKYSLISLIDELEEKRLIEEKRKDDAKKYRDQVRDLINESINEKKLKIEIGHTKTALSIFFKEKTDLFDQMKEYKDQNIDKLKRESLKMIEMPKDQLNNLGISVVSYPIEWVTNYLAIKSFWENKFNQRNI